jgi:hypothetical protein
VPGSCRGKSRRNYVCAAAATPVTQGPAEPKLLTRRITDRDGRHVITWPDSIEWPTKTSSISSRPTWIGRAASITSRCQGIAHPDCASDQGRPIWHNPRLCCGVVREASGMDSVAEGHYFKRSRCCSPVNARSSNGGFTANRSWAILITDSTGADYANGCATTSSSTIPTSRRSDSSGAGPAARCTSCADPQGIAEWQNVISDIFASIVTFGGCPHRDIASHRLPCSHARPDP